MCNEKDEVYCISNIKKLRTSLENFKAYVVSHRFLHDRINYARHHFRYITPLTADDAPVCPRWEKVHL
ncbi:MAG: hypothetical protein J6Q67_08215 [Clostridia bacterium]|nr:hypothetical protein [Clostridia bacterium]